MKGKLTITTLIFLIVCLPLVAQQITFIKDVAPIIHTKCAPCHRPNEAAPFSLITYEDVAKRASFIKDVIQSGYMPPWKPDNHYVQYDNDRSLSQKEKETILKWVENKAPKGEGKESEATIKELKEGITAYGRKPDLTLNTLDAYTLPGDNYERFL